MGAEWITALQAACPEVEVRLGEPMAEHVSFRLGGPAAAMAFPNREEQVRQLLAFCDAQNITPLILGAGTNVLPPDGGLETLVLCLKGGLMTLERQGDCIVVGAGVTMAQAAAFAADQGLAGLEFAHGIPGTMGGGVYMNAGAYGGELCQVCVETTAMGAAFLAGLAVGYWKDTDAIAVNRTTDRIFTPAISGEKRAEMIRGWDRAVRCSYGWAKED